MSHNVKKLPLRLRLRAEQEKRNCNSSGNDSAPATARIHKRRRREARQRRFRGIIKYPKNLIGLERQKLFRWNLNHVWHAKRFHMKGIWGWKMAMFRNDRGLRASYRSAQSAVTIFDASSWTCILIS